MKNYELDNPTGFIHQIKGLETIYLNCFGYKTNGVYVEVGANNGMFVSNTYGLSKIGWMGLLIEPQERFLNEAKIAYKDFPNTKFHNGCVGEIKGKIKLFIGETSSLATINEKFVDIYNQISWSEGILNKEKFVELDCDTLNNILIDNNIPKNFDLLVIDVEGAELSVLNGFDISNWNPKMVIIEMCEMNEHRSLTCDNDKINEYFNNAGYYKIYKDEINTIFIKP